MRNEGLLKLRFAGVLHPHERLDVVRRMRTYHSERVERLGERLSAGAFDDPFHKLTTEYALGWNQWACDWCDATLDRLLEWGVDTIFGLPGDGINGMWEAMRKRQDEIRYVHVRHEEVASMAAVGYAKFTGKLGVCMATAAPGAIHMANGCSTQSSRARRSSRSRHDLSRPDRHALSAGLRHRLSLPEHRAYNQRIMGPAHITNVVDLACRTALGQRGPAHIAFPIDYQVADASDIMRFKRNVPGHTTAAHRSPVRVPPAAELQRACDVLSGCERIADDLSARQPALKSEDTRRSSTSATSKPVASRLGALREPPTTTKIGCGGRWVFRVAGAGFEPATFGL